MVGFVKFVLLLGWSVIDPVRLTPYEFSVMLTESEHLYIVKIDSAKLPIDIGITYTDDAELGWVMHRDSKHFIYTNKGWREVIGGKWDDNRD